MTTYREQLAEAMVPVAMELAFTVRTGSADDVAAVLDRVHPVHLPALAVVLAAAVDIDRTEDDLFGWCVDVPVDSLRKTRRETLRETWARAWPRMTRNGVYPAQAKSNRDKLECAVAAAGDRHGGEADSEEGNWRKAA